MRRPYSFYKFFFISLLPTCFLLAPNDFALASAATCKKQAEDAYKKHCSKGSGDSETANEAITANLSGGSGGGDDNRRAGGYNTALSGASKKASGEIQKELEKIEKCLKANQGDPQISEAEEAKEKLDSCKQGFDQLAKAGDEQAEKAKKGDEERGGGGQMPDLSGLMKPKEPKPEEEKKEVMDCSNPTTAASNPVCLCQVNPRGAGCGSQEQTQYEQAVKERRARDSSGETPLGGAPTSSGYAADTAPKKASSGGLPAGGGGGGGVGGGSGGGSPSGADNTYGAPLGKVPGVIEGSYGGGGGGGGKPAYRMDTPLGRNAVAIARNLASTRARSAQMKDGVTGPHTNLFGKVRFRYISIRSTLNP